MNKPIKPGDKFQNGVELTTGDIMWGTIQTVKRITSDGKPIYRSKWGKVDKIAEFWRTPPNRVPAHSLKAVDFPACGSQCAFVELMGVSECESACPWKFDSDGNPVAQKRCASRARQKERTVNALVRRAVQEHTMLSDPEKAAIERALDAGAQYGYGNVMAWLATEWAVCLRDEWNLPEATAIAAVGGMGPYPLPSNAESQGRIPARKEL